MASIAQPALRPIFDPRTLQAGHSYRVARSEDGVLRGFELSTSRVLAYRVEVDKAGQLHAVRVSTPTDVRVERVQAHIESSLWNVENLPGDVTFEAFATL